MTEIDKCREGKGTAHDPKHTTSSVTHNAVSVMSQTGTGVYSLVFGDLTVHWHQTLESH